MIPVLPMLLLNSLSVNTDVGYNAYNYKTTYELRCAVNVLNVQNTFDNKNVCANGEFYFSGTCYINNANSYRFNVNDFGFSIWYYVESTYTTYLNYGDNNSTNGFYFDERDTNIVVGSSIDYLYDSTIYFNLRTGSFDISATDTINQDFIFDYVYDVSSFENMTIDNIWVIDFANNSTWIDYFEYSINTAIVASADNLSTAFDLGYSSGFSEGEQQGYSQGYDNGLQDGDLQGYQEGYREGYEDGAEGDATAVAIFGGILAIGMVPVNFFLAIFNFEVFGINLSGFVSSLLSVAVVIIVLKRVLSTEG